MAKALVPQWLREIPREMSLMEMTECLLQMAQPRTNDKRQENYCNFINIGLSHLGGERCMLVGSTQEGTKLRLRKDNGDFDFLVISETSIPVNCLEHVDDIPCFVHINGTTLHDKFPDVQLVDGKHIPSSLLSECRPEAFKLARIFLQLILHPDIFLSQNITFYTESKIKAGMALDSSTYEISDAFSSIIGKNEIDFENILTQITHITNNPSLDKATAIFRKVVDLLHSLKENDKSKTVPMMYQQFGKSLDALEGKISCSQIDLDLKTSSSEAHPTSTTSQSNENTSRIRLAQNEMGSLRNSADYQMSVNKEERDENMILKRLSISHQDYIPVFPLSGKLKFLDDWQKRRRFWPTQDTVEDIYHSEVFVAAKPATISPNESKDFSLSFNIAEMKLAKAMSVVQRKTVLILKAFKQSALVEFSDIVTSFHWKTVVYWVSEKWDQTLFVDTEHAIIEFLMAVLEYMTDCLCKQELKHYFVPANLFVGMSVEKAFEILPKIIEIQENPQDVLFQFFIKEHNDLIQPENKVISSKQMQTISASLIDPTQQSKMQGFISLITDISKWKDKVDLKEVVLDVIINSLPFLKEEMERDQNTEMVGNGMVPASLDDVFNSLYSYVMAPDNDKEAIETTKTRLLNDILSLDPRQRKDSE